MLIAINFIGHRLLPCVQKAQNCKRSVRKPPERKNQPGGHLAGRRDGCSFCRRPVPAPFVAIAGKAGKIM